MPSAAYSPPRPISSVEAAAQILRAEGHRFTASRRLALEGLLAADGPASAEHLAGGLDGRTGPADLPSVYRNLELFEQLGLVRHVHIGHSAGLYALVGQHEHSYAVCERCGKLTRLDAGALDEIRAPIKRATGFQADFSHFPILGLCRECAGSSPTSHPVPPIQLGGSMSQDHDIHAHDDAHSHEHSHGDETHSHPHDDHDHNHVEHEHEHSHGDRVHSHPHAHQENLEDAHDHDHED
ncbi:MAG: transcriptional repressor [Solirubrobacterales bacterium]|nr:transcriptional repressor [Solirubrobacterales bacterium]